MFGEIKSAMALGTGTMKRSDLEQSIHLGVTTTFMEKKKLRQNEAQEKECFQTLQKQASTQQQLLPGLYKHLEAQPC